MKRETRIDTPAARGAITHAKRQTRGLSQQSLAEATGVSRSLIDLEAVRDLAKLGKTPGHPGRLGLSLAATEPSSTAKAAWSGCLLSLTVW